MTASPSVLPRLAIAAAIVLHAAFFLSVLPPGVVLSGEPVADVDFALHFSHVSAASEFLAQGHPSWGYSPYFMAGYPMGTIFHVNSKGIEITAFALTGLGLELPVAYNLVILLAILLPPWALWLTARNFGLTPSQQALVVATTAVLWIVDPQISKTWQFGVIAQGIVLCMLPFSLSCLYRFYRDGTWFWYLGFLGVTVPVSLYHPLSFVFFYTPVGLYLLVFARRKGKAFWGGLALFALLVLLVNLFWIVPFLSDLHLKTRSGYHWSGDLHRLKGDVLYPWRWGLRLLVDLLGAGGLWLLWKPGREERARFLFWPIALLMGSGYGPGELPVLRELETYRNTLAAAVLLILPASVCVTELSGRLRVLPGARRVAATLAILVASFALIGQNLARAAPFVRGELGKAGLGPLHGDDMALVRWIDEHAPKHGRVLIEHWEVGALLPWYTGHEVIGGPYPLVWLQHNFANFAAIPHGGGTSRRPIEVRLFGRGPDEFASGELRTYLNTYNVGCVVAKTEESRRLFDGESWLDPVGEIGVYRIYRNLDPASQLLEGSATVSVDYGALVIRDASPGELILKYHWSPRLVSDPPQAIEPVQVLDDPVPFIRVVDNRYAEFTISDRPPG